MRSLVNFSLFGAKLSVLAEAFSVLTVDEVFFKGASHRSPSEFVELKEIVSTS